MPEFDSTTLKTSLLVNKQVPEFVRDEHPLFISFLEAYYEFLETEQGTQNNDLTKISKDLKRIQDIDASIEAFENNFLNEYANLVPKDSITDKAFLIKNILPLYLAKGNQKSFEFLFRLFYGQEADVSFPKEQILRASDGEYSLETVIRIRDQIVSFYNGDGTTKEFKLAQAVTPNEITLVVDGTTLTSGFFTRKEEKKLFFLSAPSNNADIRVIYNSFDQSLLNNRKITGATSGSTATVETAAPRLLEFPRSVELFVNRLTLVGTFVQAEQILTNIVDSDNELINISCNTTSSVETLTLLNGGNDYNVGDPVVITSGVFDEAATAVVGSVRTGFTDDVTVHFGGSGFEIGGVVRGGNTEAGFVTLSITGVNNDGINQQNSFTALDTTIDSIDTSTTLDSSDYGFITNIIPTGENLSTRIVDTLSSNTISGIGSITTVSVLSTNAFSNAINFDADGAKLVTNTSVTDIKTFGTLGRISVTSGGTGYEVGDELVFTGGDGFGAAAAVKTVGSSGEIEQVEFQPPRIDGTVSILSSLNQISGSGTSFTSDLAVNDQIIVNNESRFVNTIISDTEVNVNSNFTQTTTGKAIGVYNRNMIGGQGFLPNVFPTITVTSSGGSSASLEVTALLGDQEQISATSNGIVGQIESISLTNPGLGFRVVPRVDLTGSGDGTATANATIQRALRTFPGRWTSSKGIISAAERKIQGANYYQDFVYVTNVPVEFKKYKSILKGLLHPAGYKNYAEFNITKSVDMSITGSHTLSNTVSGTVNVAAGGTTVEGTNTKFLLANTNTISIGSQISVNNEIREIASFVTNTSLTVTAAFTSEANDKSIIIIA